MFVWGGALLVVHESGANITMEAHQEWVRGCFRCALIILIIVHPSAYCGIILAYVLSCCEVYVRGVASIPLPSQWQIIVQVTACSTLSGY